MATPADRDVWFLMCFGEIQVEVPAASSGPEGTHIPESMDVLGGHVRGRGPLQSASPGGHRSAASSEGTGSWSRAVCISTIGYPYDGDDEFCVQHLVDDSELADTNPPDVLFADQPPGSTGSWVVTEIGDRIDDTRTDSSRQLPYLPCCCSCEFDVLGHSANSARSSVRVMRSPLSSAFASRYAARS